MEKRGRLSEALKAGPPVVITCHGRPDGDALGSALGLLGWLRERDIAAHVLNADGVPDPYGFLPLAGEVLTEIPEGLTGYVLVVLDTPGGGRIAGPPDVLERARKIINIDHHPDNDEFGDINIVDVTASSVALLVYEFIASAGGGLSAEAASALYVGVMTDTGGFRFGNTDARTLDAAAALVRAGADPSALASAVYGEQPLGSLRLLGMVLERMEVSADGKVALSIITREMKRVAGSTGEEIEGIAGYGRLVRGVEVALLLREEDEGRVRVSLRSKGSVDVNKVAARLGGGGHRAAAGVLMDGTVAEVREALLAAVAETLAETPATTPPLEPSGSPGAPPPGVEDEGAA